MQCIPVLTCIGLLAMFGSLFTLEDENLTILITLVVLIYTFTLTTVYPIQPRELRTLMFTVFQSPLVVWILIHNTNVGIETVMLSSYLGLFIFNLMEYIRTLKPPETSIPPLYSSIPGPLEQVVIAPSFERMDLHPDDGPPEYQQLTGRNSQ
jgi:hypothetical protein